ncbi:hypothetical protein DSECCO2_630080 [anaerobic digester metagenome]
MDRRRRGGLCLGHEGVDVVQDVGAHGGKKPVDGRVGLAVGGERGQMGVHDLAGRGALQVLFPVAVAALLLGQTPQGRAHLFQEPVALGLERFLELRVQALEFLVGNDLALEQRIEGEAALVVHEQAVALGLGALLHLVEHGLAVGVVAAQQRLLLGLVGLALEAGRNLLAHVGHGLGQGDLEALALAGRQGHGARPVRVVEIVDVEPVRRHLAPGRLGVEEAAGEMGAAHAGLAGEVDVVFAPGDGERQAQGGVGPGLGLGQGGRIVGNLPAVGKGQGCGVAGRAQVFGAKGVRHGFRLEKGFGDGDAGRPGVAFSRIRTHGRFVISAAGRLFRPGASW